MKRMQKTMEEGNMKTGLKNVGTQQVCLLQLIYLQAASVEHHGVQPTGCMDN